MEWPAWSWTYGSWIFNYLSNQCLSPLTLWDRTPLRRGVLDTTLCDKDCQWLAAGGWFSQGNPVSSTNKTDRHDITEILLKVALNTINQTILQVHILTWNEEMKLLPKLFFRIQFFFYLLGFGAFSYAAFSWVICCSILFNSFTTSSLWLTVTSINDCKILFL